MSSHPHPQFLARPSQIFFKWTPPIPWLTLSHRQAQKTTTYSISWKAGGWNGSWDGGEGNSVVVLVQIWEGDFWKNQVLREVVGNFQFSSCKLKFFPGLGGRFPRFHSPIITTLEEGNTPRKFTKVEKRDSFFGKGWDFFWKQNDLNIPQRVQMILQFCNPFRLIFEQSWQIRFCHHKWAPKNTINNKHNK